MVIKLLTCAAVVAMLVAVIITHVKSVKRSKANKPHHCCNIDWAANRCSYLNAYDHTCMHPCSAACDYQMAVPRGKGDGFDGFK